MKDLPGRVKNPGDVVVQVCVGLKQEPDRDKCRRHQKSPHGQEGASLEGGHDTARHGTQLSNVFEEVRRGPEIGLK